MVDDIDAHIKLMLHSGKLTSNILLIFQILNMKWKFLWSYNWKIYNIIYNFANVHDFDEQCICNYIFKFFD